MKWYSHGGKRFGRSSKSEADNDQRDPIILLLDLHPKTRKARNSDASLCVNVRDIIHHGRKVEMTDRPVST